MEALAQHWHCRPSEVRDEDENDVAVALAWKAAEAEARRQADYFRS